MRCACRDFAGASSNRWHASPAARVLLRRRAAQRSSYAQFEAVPSPAKPDNAYDRAVANPKQDHAARSMLDGPPYAQQREPIPDNDAVQGVLQTGDAAIVAAPVSQGDLLVTGLLNGAVALFGMTENLFGPPAALAPAGYKKNPGWGEFFIEPGLSATYRLGPSATLYGSFAYVESSTRGMDNCCVGNIYYGNRELLFGGIRWRDADSGLSLDASYGQQDYTVGNQMLLGRAGSNGAHRGANQIGPRNAWANAGIVKAAWQDFNVQAFYLKPNEEPTEATGTIFNGINAEWLPAGPVRLGFMYLYVPDSNIVTRDQLNIYDLRARVHPVPSMPHFWLDGEYVWQRKSSVAADGWYAQANYNALDTAWKPLVLAALFVVVRRPARIARAGKASTRCISRAAIPTGTRGRSARRSSTTPTFMRPAPR